jgi:hydrophobic/amphiphilic exporter-1 (mainly G- bacteria), HAE1 family
MMTSMATWMGTLPIALDLGAGAEARRALGVSIVGGLFFSQIVTLFVTPVVYIYMKALRVVHGAKQGVEKAAETVEKVCRERQKSPGSLLKPARKNLSKIAGELLAFVGIVCLVVAVS